MHLFRITRIKVNKGPGRQYSFSICLVVLLCLLFNIPVSGSLKIKPKNDIVIDKAYFLAATNQPVILEVLDYGVSLIHLPKGYQPKQPFVIVVETKESKQINVGPGAKI